MSENDIVERLRAVLKAVIDDIHQYERINNLSPNPPRTECWDSVADALVVLEETANCRLHQLLAEASVMHTSDMQRIAEAAAFLDGLAARMNDTHFLTHLGGSTVAAADCRAMAAKLRGDNG